ncbi:transposase [Chitinophaga sancti]|uniref:Transposase n=3 Tax=Chitinophaga sancti TaxID=1004 RepID=A0ABZ0XJJ0_9BACT|nr:transposase [Chitinophaga sancti]WQD63578.1 transposase [Chitinophaga sancti]WQG90796.1 transposase [Chitinophaga sancti]
MIRYTPAKQLTLEGFSTPFSQQLSTTNRWVILAAKIPWDKLADVYYKKMRADFGAPTLSARMVIGAVIIKHILNIDDREVVAQITENIYLQYFVGLSSFQKEAPFDASLMVSIRKRLGIDLMSD